MDRLELLKQLSFGARVAEDEVGELATYFVETDQWARIFGGEVDIVKGDKGAGKSAIYSLLVSKSSDLFDKNILLVAAEQPQGAPVFKELEPDPPTTETEFVGLWKLYILTLIVETASAYGIDNHSIADVRGHLAEQGMIHATFDLRRLLKSALRYARAYLSPQSIEGSLTIDPNTGFQTVTGKITPSEPNPELINKGFVSLDRLVSTANNGLIESGYQIWVLLDRLDVAFAETPTLEKNALRALFRVYRDFTAYANIKLKIFIRSDIWKRIVDEGFREASHITKDVTLEWTQPSLLNLIMRRALKNDVLLKEWNLDRETILKDAAQQSNAFYTLFPGKVDSGTRKPTTLAWILSRCTDSTGKTAPREVIHLLNSIREEEAKRIQHGEELPADNKLFDRAVFKSALPAVSRARLDQTLYAEYPEYKELISKLKDEKTEQSPESLAIIWKMNATAAASIAESLVEIGFFLRKGSRDAPTYWVPFLYRGALGMVQGTADED